MNDPFMAYLGLGLTWVDCLVFLIGCAYAARPEATRNSWAGIRLEATMASDEAWRAAHRAALRHARLASLSLLPPSAVVIAFFHQAPVLITVLEWGFMVAGLIWILVATAVGVRAARAVAGTR